MRRVLLSLLLALGLAGPAAAATLVGDYRFREATDTNLPGLPAPPLSALTPICGYATEDVLGLGAHFARSHCLHQGMALPMSGVDPGGYTVALLTRVVFEDGYRRLFDASEGTKDAGLYTVGGRLTFYPVAQEPTASLPAGPYRQVVITRDAATRRFTVYVDGTQRLSLVDTADVARLTGATARFFLDNNGEDQSALVARARVWSGALTAAEVARLTTLADLGAPAVTFERGVAEADNRVYLEGRGGANRGNGQTAARDLPVEYTIRDALGAVVAVDEAEVADDGTWRARTFEPLPAGAYSVEVSQADADGNTGRASGSFTVVQKLKPQQVSGLPEDVRPATPADRAVWRSAETLRQWMHYLGESALLDGLLDRNFGRRANGSANEWLSFNAPSAGRLFVRVGRLSRRSCCADVVGWTQVEFKEAGRKAFALDRPVVTTKLAQGAEYWFSVIFRPKDGTVAQLGSQREVLTWRSNCGFTPDDMRDDAPDSEANGCFIGNPCRLAPADRRGFDETCAEYRTRQKVLRENRRQRKLNTPGAR